MTETFIGFGHSNLVLRNCLLFGACYLVLSPLVLSPLVLSPLVLLALWDSKSTFGMPNNVFP